MGGAGSRFRYAPAMDETTTEDALLAAAAAPIIRLGSRVESQLPGVVVLVSPKIKLPVALMLILSVVSFGAWIPFWILLACLPRVSRLTLTVADGVVVRKRSWRSS